MKTNEMNSLVVNFPTSARPGEMQSQQNRQKPCVDTIPV